jgi:dissimilatory sulfite reductase (desulfoviridin) alpha/beta subunit
MSALSHEALRRGWCPSALRPMETGDGWLVRLHPPGAVLTPAQLIRIAGLAARYGNGLVEISARANLQIRGVSLATHPELVATLLAERLVEEHDGDGPQRLTLVSPLLPPPACGGEGRGGGESPGRRSARAVESRPARPPIPNPSPPQAGGRGPGGALIDAAALADAIEARGRAIHGLPAKCLVIVDDGGPFSLDAFACDLRVVAVARDMVAIGLPDGRWRGPVATARAPERVADLLTAFAAHHGDNPDAIRRLRDLPPMLLGEMIAATGLPPTPPPAARPAPRRAGRFVTAHGQAALIGLPFGRSDAGALERLGEAALHTGVAEIRLSPWRGLAFSGMEPAAIEPLLTLAAELGLIVDPDDPRLSVAACAGKPACLRAHSEAMADAAALANAAAPLLATGASIHVSACVKSCAHAGASDLTLVGRDGGYDVIVAGTTRDKPIATLDLPAILARLRPGQDLFTRVSRRGTTGPRV